MRAQASLGLHLPSILPQSPLIPREEKSKDLEYPVKGEEVDPTDGIAGRQGEPWLGLGGVGTTGKQGGGNPDSEAFSVKCWGWGTGVAQKEEVPALTQTEQGALNSWPSPLIALTSSLRGC